MAAGLEMDTLGPDPGCDSEGIRRRGSVSQHFHRALHPSVLPSLEWSVLSGRRGRHPDCQFAYLVVERHGDGALHRYLPDSFAVPDFQVLHGGLYGVRRALAGWAAPFPGPVLRMALRSF